MMEKVCMGQGAGSVVTSRTEQAGLPDDLLKEIFKYLTFCEQGRMFQVSQELGELAVMEPHDLLKDLENFHKGLAELLSDPRIEERVAEVHETYSIVVPVKEMVAEFRRFEEMLGSRLIRKKDAELLPMRLIEGKRKLSKEEAGIYQELMKMDLQAILCLCTLLPVFHTKVIKQIIACQSALTLQGVDHPRLQEWARKGKFELTKMLFDSMERERQSDFGHFFAMALLAEGDIENALPVADSIPDQYMRRFDLGVICRDYLIFEVLENVFKRANESFNAPAREVECLIDVIRDLILVNRDYEGAQKLVECIEDRRCKETGSQIIRILPLIMEGKIEEADAIMAAMEKGYVKDRCLSISAFFFVQQGKREEAERYYSQMHLKIKEEK